jgi:hypothetical protein
MTRKYRIGCTIRDDAGRKIGDHWSRRLLRVERGETKADHAAFVDDVAYDLYLAHAPAHDEPYRYEPVLKLVR